MASFERLHKTMLNEFYRIAFRKTLYVFCLNRLFTGRN